MKKLVDQYMRNYHEVIDIIETKIETNDDLELLNIIKKNTKRKREIIIESDEILKLIFDPLEKKASLNREENKILHEWAMSLLTEYANTDYGLANRIFRLLYLDAKNYPDLNLTLCYMYYYAITDYMVRRINPRYNDTNLFALVDPYLDMYDLLTDEGKKYFLRLYANQILLLARDDIKKRREIVRFIEQKKEEQSNANIPYDTYLLSVHRNITILMDGIPRMVESGKAVSKEYIEFLSESAQYLQDHKDLINTTLNPDRLLYSYSYRASKFLLGETTIDEFLVELENLMVPKPDYTLKELATCHLGICDLYISYAKAYKNIPNEDLYSLFSSTIEKSLDFIRNIKISDCSIYIENEIESYITLLISYVNYPALEKKLFTVMSARNLDNGIHCKVSAILCRTIAEYILEHNPEFFIGVDDFETLQDVLDKKSELLDVCYNVGLFHNLGSKDVENLISVEHRSLLPIETKIVKLHPYLGYNSVKDSLIPQTMIDGILLHHLWSDGTNGYPIGYSHTNNKPLVDILAFAIAIDSSTNAYARPYQSYLSLDEFLNNSLDDVGRHYNRVVVEACMQKQLYDKIAYILKDEKEKTIIEAYRNGMLDY